jgi:hypothetical protein
MAAKFGTPSYQKSYQSKFLANRAFGKIRLVGFKTADTNFQDPVLGASRSSPVTPPWGSHPVGLPEGLSIATSSSLDNRWR